MSGRLTGIGRMLIGLINALLEIPDDLIAIIGVQSLGSIPHGLKSTGRIKVSKLPATFILSEARLAALSRKASLYISPYRKLPLFGVHCHTINTVHDVLDITNLGGKYKWKNILDKIRLKRDLKRADLTWYDSQWSLNEVSKLIGFTGEQAKVRHLGIETKFYSEEKKEKDEILDKYGIKPGYIFSVSNGLPHKNLGILLDISNSINRPIVIAGVSNAMKKYWETRHPNSNVQWIETVDDDHLPVLYQEAFCLVHPSTEEGYGYPPLESMACGTPAVVSNIPVLLETTGKNALTADAKSPRKWLNAIGKLEDKSFYFNQAKRGREWASQFKGVHGWREQIGDIFSLIHNSGK